MGNLFSGESIAGFPNSIQLETGQYSGNAGNLLIEAKNISFLDGAWLDSSSEGMGNGGTISLKAEDTVLFRGERRNGYIIESIFVRQ